MGRLLLLILFDMWVLKVNHMQSTCWGLVQRWGHLVAEVLFSIQFEFARTQLDYGCPFGDINAGPACCAPDTPPFKSLAVFLIFPYHIVSFLFMLPSFGPETVSNL